MPIPVIQALDVDTIEDHSRFATIHISCNVILDRFGIVIQDVNNDVIRHFIIKGVSEAVRFTEEETKE